MINNEINELLVILSEKLVNLELILDNVPFGIIIC